jgi:leader peptidase (prepilin peptidase)/N-methyltransferase
LAALIGAMLGLTIGSFVAVLVLRTIAGQSAITGRSACDGCAVPLSPGELIPLWSYIGQQGRCRRCGARIDPLHPIAEGLAAIIGGLAGWLSPDAGGLALATFGWLLLALALIDARALWLPDQWTIALALGGLSLGTLATGVPLTDRLIGGVAGFASLSLIAFAYHAARGRDGMGGGDPKLFGAIGLWLGWVALPPLLLIAALVGLAVAALRMIGHRGDWRTMELPLGTLLAMAAGMIGFAMAGAAS